MSAFDVVGYAQALSAVVAPFGTDTEAVAALARMLRARITGWHCALHPDHDLDGDGLPCATDCNDGDPTVRPGLLDAFDAQKCPGPLLPDGCTMPGGCCGDGVDQDCSGLADDAPGYPDCHPVFLGKHRYLMCSQRRTWQAARDNCKALGADLVVLDMPVIEGNWANVLVAWSQGLLPGKDKGAWVGSTPQPDGTCPQTGGAGPTAPCEALRASVCEDLCPPGLDADGDGESACGKDCDDTQFRKHAGAAERCDEGDLNCDGTATMCSGGYDDD